MPMAGFGTRFSTAGWDTPKPIINVEDKPMFINALNSFDNFDVPLNITVVIRKEHSCFFDSDKVFMLYGKKIHPAKPYQRRFRNNFSSKKLY